MTRLLKFFFPILLLCDSLLAAGPALYLNPNPTAINITSNPDGTAGSCTMTVNGQTINRGLSGPECLGPQVISTGDSLSYTVSVTSDSGWLQGGGFTANTPGGAGLLMLSVPNGGFAAGTYNGSTTITSAGASNSPITIPVTLTVIANTPFTVTPTSLNLTGVASETPPRRVKVFDDRLSRR